MDGVGVIFAGVFENRGEVPVTLSHSLMLAYTGEVPTPGTDSPLTETPYGQVPPHGVLPFTLKEAAVYNNQNGTSMWRVAADTFISYYVRGEYGGVECGRVQAAGPALAFTK